MRRNSSWVLDVGCRMADAVEESLDLVVAQGGAVLVGLEFGGQREILQGPAKRAISYSSEARVPEPGLPTLKRLPFTSSKLVTPASGRTSTVNGLGMHGKTPARHP